MKFYSYFSSRSHSTRWLRLYLGSCAVSFGDPQILWNANEVWYMATFGSFWVRNLINSRATSNDKVGVTKA